MRVGADAKKIGEVFQKGAFATIDYAKDLGLEGLLFRSVLDLSPTLDDGELVAVKEYAAELGLYLELGIGRVNPYNIPEIPEIRAFGGGDYRYAIECMIRAARSIGCVELWAVTAGYNPNYPGYFSIDRFRTDAPWVDQLIATEKFISMLAPLLRDLGCRINIETHEDITTFELVRMVENIGADILGITFDTGNVLNRGEDPIKAAKRIAPYVHQTHVKDAIIFFESDGLVRQQRPIGEGVLDWEKLLSILAEKSPDLNLSIEDNRGWMKSQIFDPSWQALHPDMTIEELAELVRLAKVCEARIESGEILDPYEYNSPPYTKEEKQDSIVNSANYLRKIIAEKCLGN